MQIILLL